MSPAETTQAYSATDNVFIRYTVRSEDQYASYWEGYFIAEIDTSFTIEQHTFEGIDVVNRVILEDLNGDIVFNEVITEQSQVIPVVKGEYKARVFCLTDPDTKYAAVKWSPHSKEFLKAGRGARFVARLDPVKVVDFDLLLYSTPYENDNRCAIIEEDDFRFVVVKEPSKSIVPGYYFSQDKEVYVKDDPFLIKNIGHYTRRFLTRVGATGVVEETFITGSQDNSVQYTSSTFDDITSYSGDPSWNDGHLFPPSFENADQAKLYTQHTTHNNPIVVDTFEERFIDSELEHRGHLFYNTAENIPAFYNITYNEVDTDDPNTDRFLYRIQLLSEHEVNTPILESVKFIMNVNEEEYEN
tara:strand:- start:1182 stop:2249 length:1068 start_codon:yes stop_codon:yes gene_type:complete